MESFFTAASILLWIVIGAIGIVVAAGILSIVGYGVLVFASKIKRLRRKRNLDKSIHAKGGV